MRCLTGYVANSQCCLYILCASVLAVPAPASGPIVSSDAPVAPPMTAEEEKKVSATTKAPVSNRVWREDEEQTGEYQDGSENDNPLKRGPSEDGFVSTINRLGRKVYKKSAHVENEANEDEWDSLPYYIPSAEDDVPPLRSIDNLLCNKQWSALRTMIATLYEYTDDKIETELQMLPNSVLYAVKQQITILKNEVTRMLNNEIIRCLDIARVLATKNIAWAIRKNILVLLEKLLVFYLIITPAAAASNRLAVTLLLIIHHFRCLTPHILQLTLRLARSIFPRLSTHSIGRAEPFFTCIFSRLKANVPLSP